MIDPPQRGPAYLCYDCGALARYMHTRPDADEPTPICGRCLAKVIDAKQRARQGQQGC